MRYLVTIYNNSETEAAITSTAEAEFEQAHEALQAELKASGELVDTQVLSMSDARVVRSTPEGVVVTDGPFTEVKEWVGGFYLLECESLDRAVEVAGRFVEARYSPIEVRRLGFDD
jgi:hypothetical protein